MNKAAQQLGRLGGKAKSEAKTEAARANGAAGGRPRRWTSEHGYYSLRALVPDGAKLKIGQLLLEIEGGKIIESHSGQEIVPAETHATAGWGDLSGDDMVSLGGCITHRRWVEDMLKAAAK